MFRKYHGPVDRLKLRESRRKANLELVCKNLKRENFVSMKIDKIFISSHFNEKSGIIDK